MSTPAFRIEKVSDRITRIFGFSSEMMYLIEGDERAALLDTCSGIGFIKPVIDSITDKPLVVLLTHGHVDHAMGASEFPKENVYINHEDKYIYDVHKTYEFRRAGLFLMGPDGEKVTDEDFTPIVGIEEYHDLKEGDRFDLGGVSVEMYACPGHTKGILVALIPEERTVLFGDACNAFTFIYEDHSTSVEEYRESLLRLKDLLDGKFDIALASHADGVLVPEIMDENIALCEKILRREDSKVPMEFKGDAGLIADGESRPPHGNIVYNPEHLTR